MNTNELIDTLSRDARIRWSFRQILMTCVAASVIWDVVIFAAFFDFRPELQSAMMTVRFDAKFLYAFSLLVTALPLLMKSGVPGVGRLSFISLSIAPALLGLACLVELIAMPERSWMPRLVGTNSMFCLWALPLFSVGPLLILFAGMRHGAPERPQRAGLIAGLTAGAIGALFYAATCFDDSPLFVATWYTIGVLGMTTVGAVSGRYALRW